MGEATYDLKARVPREKALAVKTAEIRAFFTEGARAEHWRRDPRGLAPEAFRPACKKKVPTVTESLGDLVGGDRGHAPAGRLDVGVEQAVDRDLLQEGDGISSSASVRHVAPWDLLAAFLKQRYRAVVVDGLSDGCANHVDPLEA